MWKEIHASEFRRECTAFTINPILKVIITRFDVDCKQDGDLLVNSLKRFLGEDVQFCRSCTSLSRRIADPFYEIGGKILRMNKGFMRSMFLEQKYSEAWSKGFALMMKGIRKYGIHIPFTPAGPFQIIWNFTYRRRARNILKLFCSKLCT